MFRCQVTKKLSKLGEKPNRIIVETRQKIYYNDEGDAVGQGWEIVKEIIATDEGKALYLAKQGK